MSCENCERHKRMAAAAIVDCENAETELRVARRTISALKKRIQKLESPAQYEQDAESVFAYWVDKCRAGNRRVVFGEERKKKVMARLKEGYTLGQLMRAIDGAAAGAYVDDNGKRHDDLELICRNEVKVDGFIARAPLSAAAALDEDALPEAKPTVFDLFGEFAKLMRHYYGKVEGLIDSDGQECFLCPVCTNGIFRIGSYTARCSACEADHLKAITAMKDNPHPRRKGDAA